MARIAVVGPKVHSYDGRDEFGLGEGFKLPESMHPLVADIYRAVTSYARDLGVEVSLPAVGPLLRRRREEWVDAVQRIAAADAVLAVLAGNGIAIPIEASLVQLMDIPMLVAAIDIDRYFTGLFREQGALIIDARQEPEAVEHWIQALFGDGEGTVGLGRGSDATV